MERTEKIKLLFVDVDGVLTDGHITMNERGEEITSFHVRDGLGLKMLMSAGIEVVIITGRTSGAVIHRAKELGITDLYQGVADKGALCRRILEEKGIHKRETVCIGDDLPDLAMFKEAGLCLAVADAAEEVRQRADFVTCTRGGHGAVREACEWILKQQGKWPKNGFTELTGG
ncbi:MAG: 3-deoxy-D-manno-octulosonate 8-phosphate phosphatase phosphatase [Thermodesulfobacteriota bacterium]|nr:3-deoxy-D-manno-octulosonate 8-phosphate phosphatase phosphatase [Thermodesulfobacteriota bacterium]